MSRKTSFSVSKFQTLFHAFLWGACSFALIFFIISVHADYQSKDPITGTNYVNARDVDSPIKVKICNSVFVDLQKVLAYNGSEFNRSSYEFLFHTDPENHNFSDREWIIRSFIDKRYLLSNRLLSKFRLDLEQFWLICSQTPGSEDCFNSFQFNLDPTLPCYEATFSTKLFGKDNAILLWLYFDPEINLGRYTNTLGAYVSISHAEEYKYVFDGIFVGPHDEFIVSTTAQHMKQSESFEKNKCYLFTGPETHFFTGVPFQAYYNQKSCDDLCYAKAYVRICFCP